ncbi:MAG TPA: YciI family protein [Bacteroidia bacterium]|nr:YciI family protein [Bacteroidia bacterium]
MNPAYSKTLADSLGADDYGMKKYVLVMLKTGKSTMDNKAKKDSLFAGHMKNMLRLVEMGKLVVAGPLKKNDNHYQGIFILNVKTKEEASALLLSDPAISAELLDPELYEWYGSAGLAMYLKYHDKVKKKNF